MDVDVIGIDNVAKVIRQSGLPRFFITHYDAGKGVTPVFEVIESNSPEVAIRKFHEWGKTILSGNPNHTKKYEIVLHNQDLNNIEDSEAASDGNIKRARKNRIRFSFVLTEPLNPSMQQMGVLNGQNPVAYQGIDFSKYIPAEEFEKRVQEKVESEKLSLKVKELERRLDNREEPEKEPVWIGIANKALDRFWPTPQNIQQQNNGAAINGLENLTDEQLDRIDDAIEKILKTDPNFISNLEKLAKLSQSNPQYFLQLIGMLQNMQL